MKVRKVDQVTDEKKIVSYIRESSRPGYTSEIFEWQYAHPQANLFLIEENEQIFGSQGMIPMDLIKDEKSVLTHKSETTFIDPSLRGRGLFEALYSASVDDAKKNNSTLIWGFTALGKVWKKKLGFDYLELIKESNLILNNREIPSFKVRLYYTFRKWNCAFKMRRISLKHTEIKEETLTDFSCLQPFNSLFTNSSVRLDYTAQTCQNRVLNSPYIAYSSLTVIENNQPIAVAIFHKANGVLVISEAMYYSKNGAEKLLKALYKTACADNCNVIRFWGNENNPHYSILFDSMERLGAKSATVSDMQLIYKAFGAELNKDDFNHFFINGFWTEGLYF